MAANTLRPIGNWKLQVERPLQNALNLSTTIMGRSGEQACKHAIILMSQSARKLTKKARKNRPVMRDQDVSGKNQYYELFKQGRAQPVKRYRFQFTGEGGKQFSGDFKAAREIKVRGLAKRSWGWGLKKLNSMGRTRSKPRQSISNNAGAGKTRKPISGTVSVTKISTRQTGGYIVDNKLDYIQSALPSGWEAEVVRRAGNRIMKQAARRMERDAARGIERMGRRSAATRLAPKDLKYWFV